MSPGFFGWGKRILFTIYDLRFIASAAAGSRFQFIVSNKPLTD